MRGYVLCYCFLFTVSTYDEYVAHVNVSHDTKFAYVCGICPKSFASVWEKREHR